MTPQANLVMNAAQIVDIFGPIWATFGAFASSERNMAVARHTLSLESIPLSKGQM